MNASTAPIERWDSFVRDFYQAPNGLRLGSSVELDRILASARAAVAARDPLPAIVPARIGNTSEYAAITFSADQARELRSLLLASVGISWTGFDGRPVSQTGSNDALTQAAVTLAGGDSNLVYRFSVAPAGRADVREALNRLMRLLTEAPKRQASFDAPLGRVIGDFNDACGLQRREPARRLLDQLSNDHRISATNRLFLRVQFLSAFEDWDELESLAETTDLLRLTRPSLVDDALARLAMRRLTPDSVIGDVQEVLGRHGALVTSTGVIHSRAGAAYYALRCLLQGEGGEDLVRRLRESGWDLVGYEWILNAWVGAGQQTWDGNRVPSLAAVHRAVEQRRLDAAVEMLNNLPVDASLLRLVLDLVPQVFSEASLALLARYRAAIDALVGGSVAAEDVRSEAERLTMPTLQEALVGMARSSSTPDECARFASFLIEHGVAAAMRPDALLKVAIELEDLLNGPHAEVAIERGVDACLDLASALRQTRATPAPFKAFALVILTMWAYSDGNSDRRRMSRVIELVADLLEQGVGTNEYSDVVDMLRSSWGPFLTDHDAGLGVEMIETLVAYSPTGLEAVQSFAGPILSRIGVHNVRRIDADVVAVAVSLAAEFGLDLAVAREILEPGAIDAQVNASGSVFIYSLMANTTDRAIEVLARRYPDLRVDSCDDKVATQRMRQLTRNADLVVIVDRASKHAATDAIHAELAGRSPMYATGRGSTSIIQAVEQWCNSRADSAAA